MGLSRSCLEPFICTRERTEGRQIRSFFSSPFQKLGRAWEAIPRSLSLSLSLSFFLRVCARVSSIISPRSEFNQKATAPRLRRPELARNFCAPRADLHGKRGAGREKEKFRITASKVRLQKYRHIYYHVYRNESYSSGCTSGPLHRQMKGLACIVARGCRRGRLVSRPKHLITRQFIFPTRSFVDSRRGQFQPRM